MLEARRFISGAEGHGVAPPKLAMPPQRQALSSPVKPRCTPAREKKEKADILLFACQGKTLGMVSGVWSGQKWDGTMERRDAVFDRDKAGESAHTRTRPSQHVRGQVLACKHNLLLLCAWVLVVEWLA